MAEFAAQHEAGLRLAAFLTVFLGVALAEWRCPRRALSIPRARRWLNNLGLVVLDGLVLRLLFPAAAAGAAAFAAGHGWGLMNHFGTPLALALPLTIVAMDLVIYLQHVLFHAVPALWRLHRVHHADLDYDLTTGARFHPIEIVLSMLVKFATIFVLGPPVVAVIGFEIVLNATAMFNHGNLRLPAAFDRRLRWILVTPDMHRVHHSVEIDETNSNFGFNLPWWDRLFGTYRDQPRRGHEGMTIGIETCRDPALVVSLGGMLRLPFAVPVKDYVINRRAPTPRRDDAR